MVIRNGRFVVKRKFIQRKIILKGRCLPFQIVGSPFLKGEWAFERTNSPVLRINTFLNLDNTTHSTFLKGSSLFIRSNELLQPNRGTYLPLERANLFVRKPIYH